MNTNLIAINAPFRIYIFLIFHTTPSSSQVWIALFRHFPKNYSAILAGNIWCNLQEFVNQFTFYLSLVERTPLNRVKFRLLFQIQS